MDKPDEKISFQEYKVLAVQDDIKKMEFHLKPFWWENIPVFGVIGYLIRMQLKEMNIDRGLLRKEILKYRYIFLFGMLIYGYAAVSILTPWLEYKIRSLGIKSSKQKLNDGNLN